jgi:hypothetical protein
MAKEPIDGILGLVYGKPDKRDKIFVAKSMLVAQKEASNVNYKTFALFLDDPILTKKSFIEFNGFTMANIKDDVTGFDKMLTIRLGYSYFWYTKCYGLSFGEPHVDTK